MTEQELRDLIAGGETLTVEFKSDRQSGLSDHDMQEAVVCLANHEGGHLLIGVEDDGHITGLHPKHARSSASALASALRNYLMGSMPPDIRCDFVSTADGMVAVVEVSKARAPYPPAGRLPFAVLSAQTTGRIVSPSDQTRSSLSARHVYSTTTRPAPFRS